MKNPNTLKTGLLVCGTVILFLSFSCMKNTVSTPPAPTVSIQLAMNSTFGNVLTDSTGKTLYLYASDASGASNCTGSCLVNWPAFYSAKPTLSSGLTATDFSTISRPDGSKQTAYKGWPLYYFIKDTKSGDVTGDAVAGLFFVAKPDYTVMLANAQLTGADGKQYDSLLTLGTGNTVYITDPYGKTIYRFAKDSFNKNKFTAADYSNNHTFPIDTISMIQNVPSILDKTKFATITVDGRTQLTYKGWPMYYFFQDSSIRGRNKAISFPTPGVWPYANKYSVTAPSLLQ